MMAPPGQALSNPGQMQNLKAALGQTAGPSNPNTPPERVDPQNRNLINLQRIHQALQKAIEPFEGAPTDATTDILHMMKGCIARIMSGVEPRAAFMVGVQSIVPAPMPAASPGVGMPPPGSPPGMGAPAAPQATAGPSLLQGMQGPVPVSPGSPPGLQMGA